MSIVISLPGKRFKRLNTPIARKDMKTTHDLDYERLWLNFNKTDKYVMVSICEGNNPAQDRNQPTSTMTSALLRLTHIAVTRHVTP